MTKEEAIEDLLRHYTGEASDMAIKALKLIEYIEQRYEEECNERRAHYADGEYHSLSLSDGASFALKQIIDKWKESLEESENEE